MPRSLEDDFSKMLVRTGALQFGMFTLSGGRISPYYLDLRVIPSFPDAFRTCSELLAKSAKSIEGVDKIGGIPTGGLPWASVLAYTLSKPLVYTRKDIKLHGREKTVEGILTPGERVLLIDDVITTGKNILTALQSIRGEGGSLALPEYLTGSNTCYSKGEENLPKGTSDVSSVGSEENTTGSPRKISPPTTKSSRQITSRQDYWSNQRE